MHDLKHNHTIDQIYLLYKKTKQELYDDYKMQAVILSNAIYYASPPSMGETKSSFSAKKRSWKDFMESLDFRKKTEKKIVQTKKDIMSLFGGLGIAVEDKKTDGDK